MVYAKRKSTSITTALGVVLKYVVVIVIINSEEMEMKTIEVCLARISWLCEHERKQWFSRHVEVWQKHEPTASTQVNSFIPINSILCRCAHITQKVTFGPSLDETVTIVVPISHFVGLQ